MYKKLLFFGALLALLTILLQVAQYRFLILDNRAEIYAGIVAIIFITLGISMGRRLTTPKEVIVEKTIYAPASAETMTPPDKLIEKLGLSKREYEVLQLMAQGLSNQEIADKSFVSVNTVKTQVSNVLLKLDAKRRTQAVTIAREMKLVS